MTDEASHYALKDAYKLGWEEAKACAMAEVNRLQAEIDRLRSAARDLVMCIIHGEKETGLKHSECLGRLYGIAVLEPASIAPPNTPDHRPA